MTNHPRITTDGGTPVNARTTKGEGPDGNPTVTRTVQASGVVSRTVREDDDEDREVLRVPISSTREDREGDAFAEDDLKRRAGQIRSEQPMVFDDHGAISMGMFGGGGYSARETIGTQFDAEVEESEDGHSTLYAYINPDGTHDEGERMLRQVRDEAQAVKFSVGFRILQSSEDVPEDDRPDRANEIPGNLFMQTDLMETSRVGIPANPDASAGIAAKEGGMGGFGDLGMHPAFARMLGVTGTSDGTAPTVKTDGGTPESPLAALRAEVAELRQSVDELREDDEDDDDDDDDDDGDGDDEDDDGEESNEGDGDGEDGEDDDDDDDEEESEELAALRDEISEIRDAVEEGAGSPDSRDTDTTSKDALPGEGKDESPDSEKDGDGDGTGSDDQSQTAMDLARGNNQ